MRDVRMLTAVHFFSIVPLHDVRQLLLTRLVVPQQLQFPTELVTLAAAHVAQLIGLHLAPTAAVARAGRRPLPARGDGGESAAARARSRPLPARRVDLDYI